MEKALFEKVEYAWSVNKMEILTVQRQQINGVYNGEITRLYYQLKDELKISQRQRT